MQDSSALPAINVYQAGRLIEASGAMVMHRRSAPLVLGRGADALVIHLDVDKPHARPDGTMAGGPPDANSIAPDEDKTRPLGEAFATYRIAPFPVGCDGPLPPTGSGRYGPTSWLLTWEVWTAAPNMAVPAHPEPDWGYTSRDPSVSYV